MVYVCKASAYTEWAKSRQEKHTNKIEQATRKKEKEEAERVKKEGEQGARHGTGRGGGIELERVVNGGESK